MGREISGCMGREISGCMGVRKCRGRVEGMGAVCEEREEDG